MKNTDEIQQNIPGYKLCNFLFVSALVKCVTSMLLFPVHKYMFVTHAFKLIMVLQVLQCQMLLLHILKIMLYSVLHM